MKLVVPQSFEGLSLAFLQNNTRCALDVSALMLNFELHICYKEVTLIPSWPLIAKDSGSIYASA